MSATRLPYRILQPTQHWRIVEGVYYRDCMIQLPDGRVQLRSVRDDLVSDAA